MLIYLQDFEVYITILGAGNIVFDQYPSPAPPKTNNNNNNKNSGAVTPSVLRD